ncbi:MAG TPA: hypothetical protein VGD97_15625 [Lacunisphaera sp.]
MKNPGFCRALLAPLFLLTIASALAQADTAQLDADNLALFERKATLAKELGATHVPITDNLPPATWQFQRADDPYPGWFIQRPDFFKLFPAKEVEPYVDLAYGKRVSGLLEARSRILRKLGLKGHWGANLPQVMPEKFFTDHPELRGPRVDQPNRSKVAWFSMCVDQPETRRLYAEAMRNLLARCPEVETFAFLTQDSGSGFCWAPSLYPGLNGHSDCKDRPMDARIADFLVTLKDAAQAAGHNVEISLKPIEPRQWMIPTLSPEQLEAVLHRLPRGIAVSGREGPDGRPYAAPGSSDAYANGAFYPVIGITVPGLRVQDRRSAAAAPAGDTPVRRLISLRGDEEQLAFSARLAKATANTRAGNQVERLQALRAFAVSEAGEARADDLLEAWTLIEEVQRGLVPLDFGDVLQFGHVLNRWINRPMVPFPAELSAADKSYYRPFLFQAKDEEQADNLADIQAMRMFEGYGARLLFQRVMETVIPQARRAQAHIERVRDAAPDPADRARWALMARRLEVAICLMHSADHMVAYQAQLDRVKALGIQPEANPVLGVQSGWDRTDLMETARKEIDNTVRLMRLLGDNPGLYLDLAPVPAEETIMKLGPGLTAQLKRKIDLMNAHWLDYDRLFTKPNP